MIQFASFHQYQPGLLVSLLSQSYAGYFHYDPGCEVVWRQGWQQYDRDVFQHPDTIGACGFVTCLAGQVIGFASWDPRQFPARGIIGHNCILPSFRGHSYGKQQILEILRIFKLRGFQQAYVTTGEHSFFRLAQRIYQACGFQEVSRGFEDSHTGFRIIAYQLNLTRLGGNDDR